MSYQTINLPNYNATINNLTVNGTLTGSVAPTGTAYTLAYYNSSGNLASSALTCDILGDITTSGVSNLNGGILIAQTGNNNTNGLKLEQSGDTTRQAYIYMNNNELNIGTSSNAALGISSNGGIQIGSTLVLASDAYFQSSQNTNLYWANTGAWANIALSTAGSLIAVPSITYQDTSTAASGTNAGPACVWSFNTPTLSATNTNVTTTTACTVYIGGAPTAGTHQTITNPYSLYVNSGNSYLGGNVTVNGNLTANNNGTSCAFYAQLTSNLSNQTGSGQNTTVVFNTIVYQNGSGYNASTGIFTAPANGFYFLSFQINIGGITSSHTSMYAFLYVTNNSGYNSQLQDFVNPYACSNSGYLALNLANVYYMLSGATAYCTIQVSGGTEVISFQGQGNGTSVNYNGCAFTGYRVA